MFPTVVALVFNFHFDFGYHSNNCSVWISDTAKSDKSILSIPRMAEKFIENKLREVAKSLGELGDGGLLNDPDLPSVMDDVVNMVLGLLKENLELREKLGSGDKVRDDLIRDTGAQLFLARAQLEKEKEKLKNLQQLVLQMNLVFKN